LAHKAELGQTSGTDEDDGAGLMMVTTWNFFKHDEFWAKLDYNQVE